MEIWKKVKGYQDYEVSNFGRVKSIARVVVYSNGVCRSYNEEVLKGSTNKQGYRKVRLYKDKKGKTRTIHQLVAMAFLNHKPSGMKYIVDHMDNNPLNNNLNNLQVITQRKNMSKDRKGGASEYTGVSWDKRDSKWYARILIKGKTKFLGRFTDELKAAEAYQTALKELL